MIAVRSWTLIALPNSEHLLRSYAAHLIVIDEAAFFAKDETIFMNGLTSMMATTGGTMIVSSAHPVKPLLIRYQVH